MGKIIKQEELKGRRSLGERLKDEETGHVEWTDRKVVTTTDLEGRQEAQKIIEEAQAQGQKIREKARLLLEQVENEREAARQDGYETGYQEGMAQATELIASAKVLQAKIVADAEPQLVGLAFDAVKKVIGRAAQEGVVREVLHETLAAAAGTALTICVNPEDRPLVEKSPVLEEVRKQLGKLIRVKDDPAIARGGCIIESEIGTVDARLEVQMEALKKVFTV